MTISKIESDPVTQFSGEILEGALESESIDFPSSWQTLGIEKCFIVNLSLQASANLEYDVYLWGTSGFADASLALDQSIGYVNFSVQDGKQIGGSGQYYYPSQRLAIPYQDEDKSGKLHCSVVNRSVTTKSGSDTIKLTFLAKPHI